MSFCKDKRDYILSYLKTHHDEQNMSEMATALKISPSSVSRYMAKIGVKSRRYRRKECAEPEKKVHYTQFKPKEVVYPTPPRVEKFCLVITDLARHKEVTRIYLRSKEKMMCYIKMYGEDKSYNLFPVHIV